MSRLDLALSYAEQYGWRVFPCFEVKEGHCTCGKSSCDSPGKHPRTRNGLKDATNDPVVIKNWWNRWPDANIAARTGKVSGLVVLDIDDPQLVETYKPLLMTSAWASTPRGGAHGYFRSNGTPIPTHTGLQVNGQKLKIDVRGEGGYVVLPGSVGLTGKYEFCSRAPLTTAPAWMANSQVSQLIVNGERNRKLFEIAASMVGRGESADAILEELLRLNSSGLVVPPLDEDEIATIAGSVERYRATVEVATDERSHSLKSFMERSLPPKVPLVEGVLFSRDRISLTGRRRQGKTTFLTNLALSGALGKPEYLGYKICRPFRTLSFYLEDDPTELQDKLRRMLNGVPPTDAFHLYTREDFLQAGVVIDAQDKDFRKFTKDAVHTVKPDLIIFDNLGQLIGADYNNAARIQVMLNFVIDLANAHDAAVIIAAHPRKASKLDDASHRITLRNNPDEFFEECMGSSHFINTTGSLWGIERDREAGTSVLLLGAQRLTGEHSLTVVEKDDNDWFKRVDDFNQSYSSAMSSKKRQAAWEKLSAESSFTYMQARTLLETEKVMGGSTFHVWWQDLLRNNLLLEDGKGQFKKRRGPSEATLTDVEATILR